MTARVEADMLLRTERVKHVIVARVLAGGLLLVFGLMHLLGMAPLRPILEGAGMPAPGLGAVLIPLMQVIAGASLLAGFYARVGAGLAIAVMLGALFTHLTHDWPDEPPMVMPIVVLAAAAYVLWRGGGAWSVDLAQMQRG
jgi:putative oxidoreductase